MAGIIALIIGFINFVVGMRFIFLLVGANPSNGFVDWIYNISAPLVAPFAGILGTSSTAITQGAVAQSVFDWTSLVALLVYGILGAIIVRAVNGVAHRAY